MKVLTGQAAATKQIIGGVTMFQFGDAASPGLVRFQVTDSKKKTHKGRMQYRFDDQSSSGFALLFTTAMVNGYQVEAVYSSTQDDEVVCTSIRLVSPA
jgi:hypothetical protein